jgi:hypothetical protein
MKTYLAVLVALCMAIAAGAQNKPKILTTDSLTGLPVAPATDSGMGLGNAPSDLPASTVCKSKMQGQFYSLLHTTTDATAAWYTQNLKDFKMVKGNGSGRAQVVFYKPDGSVIVIVTGGYNSPDAYSVAYERYTPGLSEKTIVGIPQGKMDCR